MWSYWTKSWGTGVFILNFCFLFGLAIGGSQIEKRDGLAAMSGMMPPGLTGPGIGMGPLGGSYSGVAAGQPIQIPQMGMPMGGGYGGYEQPQQPYGPPQQPPPQYAQPPPPYPPFGYKDPGFSVQTGFEGFLVPNSWYGLLPWGIEGVVIVIVGIIVAMVIVVSIVALLVWLTGFSDLALVKEQARSMIPSSFLPSGFNMDYLNQITTAAYNALDRYNELVKAE